MSDRNAAKRRRSAQNKRERDARATRVAKARTDTATPAAKASTTRGRAASQRSPGPSTLNQRWTDSESPNPGARMVLLSVLLAIVASLMLYFIDIVPIEREVGGRTVVETTSLAADVGPKVLPYLAIPVLIAGIAWFATRWPARRRRRAYVVAAVMLWLWTAFTMPLGLLYIVSAIALSVGAWQYANSLRGPAPAGDDADDEVDDEVDPDEEDDEDGADDRPTLLSRLRALLGR